MKMFERKSLIIFATVFLLFLTKETREYMTSCTQENLKLFSSTQTILNSNNEKINADCSSKLIDATESEFNKNYYFKL